MSRRRKSNTCIDCRIEIHGKSTRCRSCFGRTCRKPPRLCDGCGVACKPGAMRCLPCSNRLRRTKRVHLCPDCGEPFSGPPAKRCHKCEVARISHRHKQHDEIWELYELGFPISEIGRRLGVSKNTISGYAWRQGWTRRKPEIEYMPQRNYFEFTAHMCLWAFGDPGTPDFHFCGSPALEGKSYCAEHAAIVYMPAKPLKEAA